MPNRWPADGPKPFENEMGFFEFSDVPGEPAEVQCPQCLRWHTVRGRSRNRWCSWTCSIKGTLNPERINP